MSKIKFVASIFIGSASLQPGKLGLLVESSEREITIYKHQYCGEDNSVPSNNETSEIEKLTGSLVSKEVTESMSSSSRFKNCVENCTLNFLSASQPANIGLNVHMASNYLKIILTS